MSLFPAYSDGKNEGVPKNDVPPGNWLENTSFPLGEDQLQGLADAAPQAECDSSASDTATELVHHETTKTKKRKVEKKTEISVPLEFSGNEEYYIDKSPAPQYKTISTLHKPACPRYHRRFSLKWKISATNHPRRLRYYRMKKDKDASKANALDENEYTLRVGQLNRKTLEAPLELEHWIEMIELHKRNPYKWSRLLLAEKAIDIVNRALVHNPRNEKLYRLYIRIVSVTYPSFEVITMIDRMLAKDQYNYTLWTARVMATQCSMASCVVPDVLRIYERCMQKMHLATSDTNSDEVMLRLFSNCALFLRQAGLYEQFVALLKLALELNVSTDKFGDFAPLESDQHTLVEYEELILQSGLPMNEIWLRIEKLRQGFNFLPCPINLKCSDPQRVVFNEDVCHYIYPLKSRDNSFFLILLILRHLKVPFVWSDSLAAKFCERVEYIGDSDAIEDVLVVCIRRTFALPQHNEFLQGLFELNKEMAVNPTFLSSNIGHEIYTRCILDLLMNCAAVHADVDERKRIVFVLLWCRFQRLLLVQQKCNKKLTDEYVKAGRAHFKALLKQKLNRNVLLFYTELAVYEFESLSADSDITQVENIFESLLATYKPESASLADLCHTVVSYAEILICCDKREKALQVLLSHALADDAKNVDNIGTTRKLVALQRTKAKLDNTIAVERNVTIMELEQYILPDCTISQLKLYSLMQLLMGQKQELLAYLEKLLNMFLSQSDRHSFLREHIQEQYVTILQLATANCSVSPALLGEKTFAAFEEFPRNLYFLQNCMMLSSAPWYKIRANVLRIQPSVHSIAFLIVLARHRFLQLLDTSADPITVCDYQHNELIVRNRILNIFKILAPSVPVDGEQEEHNVLRRNALFWRLYLRCLSDQRTAFETTKKCLFTALDECPWSKALYMDGATYVPQQMSHLQDLIIEKQLRIYALPEELEILREK